MQLCCYTPPLRGLYYRRQCEVERLAMDSPLTFLKPGVTLLFQSQYILSLQKLNRQA